LDIKAKKMSALAVLPSYQTELTGSHSLYHCDMTNRKTDGFPAVNICSNLAFLGSGGYWSASHYDVVGSEVGKKTDFLTGTSVPIANLILPMQHTHFFMQYRSTYS
jgi:hypothetical protein